MKVENNLLEVVGQKVLYNDVEHSNEEPIKQTKTESNIALKDESIDGDTLEITHDALDMQTYVITGEIVEAVASKIAKSIIG